MVKNSVSYQYILLCDGQVLLPKEGGSSLFWSPSAAFEWLDSSGQVIEVGQYQGVSCRANAVKDEVAQQIVRAGGELLPLRALLQQNETLFALAGRAVQLLDNYRQHRFCGLCGNPTEALVGEHAMRCKPCGQDYYPRLSPCAIMLVTRGEDCLLAQHGGRGDYFSCLAGFMEPGETVEQTVCREVQEEVNIAVTNTRYFSSQYWPFPGQIMLGFYADYESGEIIPDGVEIVQANWCHYSDLPPHPAEQTISGQLIRHFVASHTASK